MKFLEAWMIFLKNDFFEFLVVIGVVGVVGGGSRVQD